MISHKSKIIFVAVFLALAISGCSTIKDKVSSYMAGKDNQKSVEPLAELEEVINIEKLWSKRIGDGNDGYYLKLTPVANEGVIYAAEREGEVTALDVETGKQHWETDTEKRLSGGPGHGEGLVLIGTRDGEVLALSDTDGEVLWTAAVSSEVLSAPKADLGVVVVRTVDGKAFGLDAESGQRLWAYERAVPLLTLRGTSSPQIADGKAIIGFDGGILTALDITNGSLIWEKRIALPTGRSTLERMVDIDAEPILKDGVIHIATFQGRVAIVDLETGNVGWSRELSSYAGLGVDDDYVYLTDELSEIWALDRYSGDSVWKQDQLKSRAISAPVSFGNYLVAGDYEGYLHWLNRQDGSLVGRVKLDNSPILSTAFVVGNMLFAYSSNGTLSAFTVQ
ncbi:MAG: outer membrane protein assembly factor BamB [Gammaproteobacteria bacterium]